MNLRTLACALPLALSGCVAQSDLDLADDESLGATVDHLYVNTSTVWPSPSIPVCWEDPTMGATTEGTWVRQALLRSWEAVSAVTFTGWGGCYAGAPGIHIRVNDEHPHTIGLGTQLSGVTGGMVLNLTFSNWGSDCQSQLEYCINAMAVHEFGHALGFAHEHNRPDTPPGCAVPTGETADLPIGAWDLHSILNYCNPIWNNDGKLSSTDIYGVQYVYGHRWDPDRTYRLTNLYLGVGRSLDTAGGGLNEPFMGNTGNYGGQYWKISHVGDGYYRLTNLYLDVGRSLDTAGGGLNEPFMGNTGNYSGQYWRIIPLGNGNYRFTNMYLGEGRALDTYASGANTPFMGVTGNYSGQSWQITLN